MPGPDAHQMANETARQAKNVMTLTALLGVVYKVISTPFTAAHRLNTVETKQTVIHEKIDRIEINQHTQNKVLARIEGRIQGWDDRFNPKPRRRRK